MSETSLLRSREFSDRSNVLILGAISTLLFTLGLWRNGFAYTYYSAAAQAGSPWVDCKMTKVNSTLHMMLP